MDAPALAWLAQKPGPRFWISDGGVTGVDDVARPELDRRCAETCKRHAIRQLKTAKETVEILAARR